MIDGLAMQSEIVGKGNRTEVPFPSAEKQADVSRTFVLRGVLEEVCREFL